MKKNIIMICEFIAWFSLIVTLVLYGNVAFHLMNEASTIAFIIGILMLVMYIPIGIMIYRLIKLIIANKKQIKNQNTNQNKN